ncbi:hypothetical protein MIND_01401700 [Mycena indigotica]|uniref:TPX2 C-terminal domain-containing protein n=1 Tax=Mycena indigotica TaxID=2126181 RepID=A0A8H6S151_9AGAR|nr:uncharacterized protein MIND_01401700 [Mycena indigotica]KAF7289390.1 hypothetical protein MIND_01401700 [Mycena indigotica]
MSRRIADISLRHLPELSDASFEIPTFPDGSDSFSFQLPSSTSRNDGDDDLLRTTADFSSILASPPPKEPTIAHGSTARSNDTKSLLPTTKANATGLAFLRPARYTSPPQRLDDENIHVTLSGRGKSNMELDISKPILPPPSPPKATSRKLQRPRTSLIPSINKFKSSKLTPPSKLSAPEEATDTLEAPTTDVGLTQLDASEHELAYEAVDGEDEESEAKSSPSPTTPAIGVVEDASLEAEDAIVVDAIPQTLSSPELSEENHDSVASRDEQPTEKMNGNRRDDELEQSEGEGLQRGHVRFALDDSSDCEVLPNAVTAEDHPETLDTCSDPSSSDMVSESFSPMNDPEVDGLSEADTPMENLDQGAAPQTTSGNSNSVSTKARPPRPMKNSVAARAREAAIASRAHPAKPQLTHARSVSASASSSKPTSRNNARSARDHLRNASDSSTRKQATSKQNPVRAHVKTTSDPRPRKIESKPVPLPPLPSTIVVAAVTAPLVPSEAGGSQTTSNDSAISSFPLSFPEVDGTSGVQTTTPIRERDGRRDPPLTLEELSPRKRVLDVPNFLQEDHDDEEMEMDSQPPAGVIPEVKLTARSSLKRTRPPSSLSTTTTDLGKARGEKRSRVVLSRPARLDGTGSLRGTRPRAVASSSKGKRVVSAPVRALASSTAPISAAERERQRQRTRSVLASAAQREREQAEEKRASTSSQSRPRMASIGSKSITHHPLPQASTSKPYTIPDFAAIHATFAAQSALRRSQAQPQHTHGQAPMLSTTLRAQERAAFDAGVRAREAQRETEKESERIEREERELEEEREARKRAVVKAHQVPEWYKEMPKKGKDKEAEKY